MSDVLIQADNVGKKFCRDLKKSLWYGVKDSANDLFRRRTYSDVLRRDEFWANRGISFELRRGECVGLIGHNGAGKTTLLKALNGLIKPDAGRIEIKGRVGALLALGAGFNPILTGRENIFVNASILGLQKREIDRRFEEIVEFSEIGDFIDAPVRTYSSGMSVRLGFAIAVNLRPDILLLDEVLAVGDAGFQSKCFNALSRFRSLGTSFILVSHNMHNIARYCDAVIYLKRGAVEFQGDVNEAIGRFLSDMEAPVQNSNLGAANGERLGSGKAIIESVSFYDEREEPCSILTPGQPVTLRVDYTCSNDVSDAYLDILIRDRDGVFYQATSKDLGVNTGISCPKGRFDIRFLDLPTNCSELSFSLALVGDSTKEIYSWARDIKVPAKNDPMLTGRLNLRAIGRKSTMSTDV